MQQAATHQLRAEPTTRFLHIASIIAPALSMLLLAYHAPMMPLWQACWWVIIACVPIALWRLVANLIHSRSNKLYAKEIARVGFWRHGLLLLAASYCLGAFFLSVNHADDYSEQLAQTLYQECKDSACPETIDGFSAYSSALPYTNWVAAPLSIVHVPVVYNQKQGESFTLVSWSSAYRQWVIEGGRTTPPTSREVTLGTQNTTFWFYFTGQ